MAHRYPQRAESIAQVCFGQSISNERKRNVAEIACLLAERPNETIYVHRWKLVAEEVTIFPNDCRGLQRRSLGNVRFAPQSTAPTSLEQRISPSDGSTARFRLSSLAAKAAALCCRLTSSNPK